MYRALITTFVIALGIYSCGDGGDKKKNSGSGSCSSACSKLIGCFPCDTTAYPNCSDAQEKASCEQDCSSDLADPALKDETQTIIACIESAACTGIAACFGY